MGLIILLFGKWHRFIRLLRLRLLQWRKLSFLDEFCLLNKFLMRLNRVDLILVIFKCIDEVLIQSVIEILSFIAELSIATSSKRWNLFHWGFLWLHKVSSYQNKTLFYNLYFTSIKCPSIVRNKVLLFDNLAHSSLNDQFQ